MKKNTSQFYVFIEHGRRYGAKKSHYMVLNFLSLKTHMTLVHRSQKPRTSDAMSTRRPCSSPLNLPGILDLLASHLRITNYGGLAGLRRSPQSSYFLPSTSSSFSSSSFSFSLSYKQSCISMTDVPRQKWPDIRYRIIKNLSSACIGSFFNTRCTGFFIIYISTWGIIIL